MFGLKGRRDIGQDLQLHTKGNQLFYLQDALGTVTGLATHQGEPVFDYRYDAFGGLYTGITAPYNNLGLTGKAYDPKASLVDFSARWYDPAAGRFLTPDSYRGFVQLPSTLHRYAYLLNNPLKNIDPTGNLVIICGFAGALSCGGGGGSGGGGEGDGGGGGGGNGGGDPPPPPPPTPEQIAAQKDSQIQSASGNAPGDALDAVAPAEWDTGDSSLSIPGAGYQDYAPRIEMPGMDYGGFAQPSSSTNSDRVAEMLDTANKLLSITSGAAAVVALGAAAVGAAPVAAVAGLISVGASVAGIFVTALQGARGDIKPGAAAVSIGLNAISAGAGFATRSVDILKTKSAMEIFGYIASRTSSVVGAALVTEPTPRSVSPGELRRLENQQPEPTVPASDPSGLGPF